MNGYVKQLMNTDIVAFKIEQNPKFPTIKELVALNTECPLTEGIITCPAKEITQNSALES